MAITGTTPPTLPWASVKSKTQITWHAQCSMNTSPFFLLHESKTGTDLLLTLPILMHEFIVSSKSGFFSFIGTSANSFPINSPD